MKTVSPATSELVPRSRRALTEAEADLTPEEHREVSALILKRYDYGFHSFDATADAFRLALAFAKLLADEALPSTQGDIKKIAEWIKLVPPSHLGGSNGKGVGIIFEGLGEYADEIQFSQAWLDIQDSFKGAFLESYSSWAAVAYPSEPRENPEHGATSRHDNITHALRAIAANEGRFLLTAAAIRKIVYGVTGREPDPSGWTRGFARQQGKLWTPVVEPYYEMRETGRLDSFAPFCKKCGRQSSVFERDGLRCPSCGYFGAKITSRGHPTWQLTEAGRVRLHDGGNYDPAHYDALAWFEKPDFYEADALRSSANTSSRSPRTTRQR